MHKDYHEQCAATRNIIESGRVIRALGLLLLDVYKRAAIKDEVGRLLILDPEGEGVQDTVENILSSSGYAETRLALGRLYLDHAATTVLPAEAALWGRRRAYSLILASPGLVYLLGVSAVHDQRLVPLLAIIAGLTAVLGVGLATACWALQNEREKNLVSVLGRYV